MMAIDWIEKWALYSPQKTAIKEVVSGVSCTYGELNDFAKYAAANLHEKYSLKAGSRIAVLSDFGVGLISLFGAALKAGFILVPINTHLTPHEISFQVDDCQADLVFYQEKYAQKLTEIQIEHKITWEDISGANFKRYSNEVTENDPVFILYTSGTTGKPKGCIYTHKMMFWNSVNTELRLDLTSNDVTLNCMPSFHTGGWNVLITPFLHRGATIWLLNDFDADAALSNLEKSKSTLFMAVPTMLKMMSKSPLFESTDLSSLRYFIVGGEAMPIPEIEVWDKKGVPIRQGFGLTEVGPNVTSLHQSDTIRKRGSIGFFNFYISARIVNEEGRVCKPNEVGELLLAGPNVSPGYWNNPQATKEAYQDGYFKTGDLVRQDDEGYIYVVGRKKEMYISGGENVYPREVEKILEAHPAVSEAAVVAVPHEKWGETGAAFLILKAQMQVGEEEILAYCKKYLAKFKLPKHVVFLETFPKNATGKIDKIKLKSFINQTTQNK